ncbi:MAG: pitrilysin family protein [Thermoguttaceae bacterium]|jgi:zinc protease
MKLMASSLVETVFVATCLFAGAWSPIAADEKLPQSQTVLLSVPDDPTISFRLSFQVGSQDDPADKEGLAALTVAMLAEGSTQKNRYDAILDRLFPLAGSYEAATSLEMTVISGRIHKDNLQEYYPLLMDAVLRPAFRQEDLDRLKSQTLNYLENTLRYAGDEELGKAVLYETLFAGTPYGHIPAGRIDGVRGITLDDVRRFYREHFTRDNVVLGLGGGYETATLDRLRSDLATLPAGKPRRTAPPRPKPVRGLQVTIIEKDAAATAISIGFPIDVLRGQADWYPLAVANSWFGEHRSPSSHLYHVIREMRGLNYGDYSYIEHFGNGGELQVPRPNDGRRQQIFEIWLRPVPNEARHFALRAAIRELQHLVDRGLSQDQFSLTRNFLGSYVLHFAPTTMARLGYALDDRFYGIQGSHLDIFRRRVHDMTCPEVNDAVEKHLQYRNLQIVIVTKDARTLCEALVADSPSPITYPSPRPAAVLKEDAEISRFPLYVKRENVRIVPVHSLFGATEPAKQ